MDRFRKPLFHLHKLEREKERERVHKNEKLHPTCCIWCKTDFEPQGWFVVGSEGELQAGVSVEQLLSHTQLHMVGWSPLIQIYLPTFRVKPMSSMGLYRCYIQRNVILSTDYSFRCGRLQMDLNPGMFSRQGHHHRAPFVTYFPDLHRYVQRAPVPETRSWGQHVGLVS